jgi:hypothetical protein
MKDKVYTSILIINLVKKRKAKTYTVLTLNPSIILAHRTLLLLHNEWMMMMRQWSGGLHQLYFFKYGFM